MDSNNRIILGLEIGFKHKKFSLWLVFVLVPVRQDLKDFMRKAGDVTYTTVNRGVRGEG